MSTVHSCYHHCSSSSHLLSSDTISQDLPSTPYIGYVDGASRYSQNLASVGWAIFTPLHALVLSNKVCIGTVTNNQEKYDAVRCLLADALSHRILHIHVHLDSLILVMKLNGVYHVHNPILFR